MAGGGGGMFGGPYNYNRKKSFKISYSHSSADQNTFYIYWFVVNLLNVMINQIQFNEFKGGLKSWEAYNQIYTVYIYIYILSKLKIHR